MNILYLAVWGSFTALHTALAMADSSNSYSQATLQTQSVALQNNATTVINNLQSLQEADVTTQVQAPTQAAFNPYPIKSTMTPGTVSATSMDLSKLVQPIFLVGSDSFSATWLQQNAAKLAELHAIGFLVQADSQADLASMKQLAGDLPLIPLNADQFAVQWHLNHYPVLITAQGIVQ